MSLCTCLYLSLSLPLSLLVFLLALTMVSKLWLALCLSLSLYLCLSFSLFSLSLYLSLSLSLSSSYYIRFSISEFAARMREQRPRTGATPPRPGPPSPTLPGSSSGVSTTDIKSSLFGGKAMVTTWQFLNIFNSQLSQGSSNGDNIILEHSLRIKQWCQFNSSRPSTSTLVV